MTWLKSIYIVVYRKSEKYMKLIIVESPHKSDTISKFLKQGDYLVKASKGQVEDLAKCAKNGFGVDVENDFKPTYVITSSQKQTVNDLKKYAKQSDEVILASDPDREGEAIAYHLARVLSLDPKVAKRIEFHEITKDAVCNALENPRTIDMDLVSAQETRRIIDRVIGFRLSSILQRKMKSPSAGRVQSATLKLIVDHDKEIEEFVPQEYWLLSLNVNINGEELSLTYLPEKDDEKLTNKEVVDKLISSLNKEVKLVDVKKSVKTIESKPGFSTSSLQIEAFNVYHMPVAVTSKAAQELYEGVKGLEGLITYIRTDATRFNASFVNSAKEFIAKHYGEEYIGKLKVVSLKGAQDAHEGIRPSLLSRTPESLKGYLTTTQYNLYKLIYERTLASLMKGKKEEKTTYIFECGNVKFKFESKKTLFDGYTAIYKHDEDNSLELLLNNVKINDCFKVNDVISKQEFSKPPLHYNEGRIVKLMEDNGIGRPSTYSNTIQRLKTHGYIETKEGLVHATESGKRTVIVLNKYFPKFIDVNYTASMEDNLDKIEQGKASELKILKDFYFPFMQEADDAEKIMYKDDEVYVDRKCPKCGAPLVVKKSKYGEFIGCSNFPACKYTEKQEKVIEYVGRDCPKCGKPLIYRKNKKNQKFIGCSGYPNCDYSEVIERKKNYKKRFYKNNKYTKKVSG